MSQPTTFADPRTSENPPNEQVKEKGGGLLGFLGCLFGGVLQVVITVVPIMLVTYIRAGMRRGTIDDTVGLLLLGGLAAIAVVLFYAMYRRHVRRREAAYQELRELVVAEHGEGSEELRALDEFAGKIPKSEQSPKSNTERANDLIARWMLISLCLFPVALLIAAIVLNWLDIEGTLYLVVLLGAMIAIAMLLLLGLKPVTARLFRKIEAQSAEIESAIRRQDYVTAIRLSEEMVNAAPGFDTYTIAALTYLQAGRWEKAETTIRKAIDSLEGMLTSSPEDKGYRQMLGSAQAVLGVALSCRGGHAEAEQALLEAIQNNPTEEMAILNYAEILLHQRKSLEVAAEYIEKAEAQGLKLKEPPKSSPIAARAWLYALQGNRTAAYEKIAEAHRIAAAKNMPALTAEVTYTEGLMYEALGEPDKAYSAFSKARSLDKDGFAGRLSTAKLSQV